MVHRMVYVPKYSAFKRLAEQTASVIESRTTNNPSELKSLRHKNFHSTALIFKDDHPEIIGHEHENDTKRMFSRQATFDEGLRIIMYDKIIKSGFNHLSIFLDDFNYIYNEVITSTNMGIGEGKLMGDTLDLQAGQLLFNEFPKPSGMNERQEVQSSVNESDAQHSSSFVNYY